MILIRWFLDDLMILLVKEFTTQMFPPIRKLHDIFVQPHCVLSTAKTKWKTQSTAQTSLRMVFWRWVAFQWHTHAHTYTVYVLKSAPTLFHLCRASDPANGFLIVFQSMHNYLVFSQEQNPLDSVKPSLMTLLCGLGATLDHTGFEENKNGRGIWNKTIV